MTRVAYFAHNIDDAAIRRRAHSLQALGATVTTYAMRRGVPTATPWANIDLGRTHDGRFAQRIGAALAAFPKLMAQAEALRGADLWIARNLDMALLATAARTALGLDTPLIYECLDIHRLMTRTDAAGAVMRALEGRVLAASAATLISAPAFDTAYFRKHFGDRARILLLENKLAYGLDLPPRPSMSARPERPLTIGWFGNLRCRRSLALMRAVSRMEGVRVVMRGYAAETEIPDFEAQVAAEPGMSFGGRYRFPDDLAAMYAEVDLVWAGDFHDAGANSAWLLPNRIYEGGYFGAPALAPSASETGRWLDAHGLGFTLNEPLETTLPALLAHMTPERLTEARRAVLQAPEDLFRQSRAEAAHLLAVVKPSAASGARAAA